ncbi:thioredoxin family protein [Nocardioides deserti]|uniref:thioredoxin family protein n=1 Tax=Nocardioides deserti TaxID=1588644 RepID=UPI003570A00B
MVVAFEDHQCGHCRSYRHVLQIAWRQLGWAVDTARVDASELPCVADRFQIVGFPTLLVFSRGDVILRSAGIRAPRDFTTRMASLLAG